MNPIPSFPAVGSSLKLSPHIFASRIIRLTSGGKRGSKGRRLGAIMFTDVVGYSSIAERDEKRALRLLDEQRDLLGSIFPKHGMRVVRTMGDAFLVEFASAVEAVECAVEIQNEVRAFDSARGPAEEKISIRIGIHIGDIVHSDGDILGDAVNVAARVQPLAEPGGICVTRQVVDNIAGKVEYRMVSMGPRALKNIRVPVEIYRIAPPSSGMSRSEETPALDPHRVAILPLANMSPDPNDRYFADGMTEELISTVSKIRKLSVISRTSVMQYRDTTVPIGQIGRELGVGTILEASVRKAGNRVRISAQLIEVADDRHIWSQSYDRDLTDVFAIQGEIAKQVAKALKVQLLSKEKLSIEKKATTNPEALTLYLKGRYYWNERVEEGTRKALKYFEEAAKVDPNFARAYSGMADCYLILADYGWMPPDQAGRLAKEYAIKALEIDDTLAEAHASLGLTMVNHHWDFNSGERELKRAIELRPNYPTAYHWYAVLLQFSRRYEEAFEMIKRAYELDPYSRVIAMSVGTCLLSLRRIDQAMEQYKKILEANPDFGPLYSWMGFAYAALSKYDDAIEMSRRAVELNRGSAETKLNLAWVYAVAGQRAVAKKILDEVLTESMSGYASPGSIGSTMYAIDQSDEAFRWFERAIAERDSSLLYVRSYSLDERLLSDPRWREIERKMDLPEPHE